MLGSFMLTAAFNRVAGCPGRQWFDTGEKPQEESLWRRWHSARMQGTSALTGKPLVGIDHLRQSIRDILTTPIGSRVMRRDYGSRLFQLIDAPMNRSTLLNIYAATAEAIARWEPRIKLKSVKASSAAPGSIVLDMTGEYLPDGRIINLDGIEVR